MTMFNEWLERVSAPEIAKGHIQQLYQRIYPLAQGGRVGGKKSSIDEYQARDIVATLEARPDGGPLVTQAQYEQGSKWLVDYGRRLELPDRIVGQRPTLFRFPRCTFRQYGWDGFYLPVYVAYYNDGSTLTYSTGSWQSQTAAIEFTYKEAA